jgi:hypothetical protein
VATGPQYAYYWGDWQKLLRQLLISVVAIVIIWLLRGFLGDGLTLMLYVIGGLYWLWSPVYWASLRNAAYRRLPYSGFLRGKILDVFITEELVNEEYTVNKRGETIIIENRERRINLEIGDETGFRAEVQAPLRRIHKVLAPGQIAEVLVLSKQPDLSQIAKITDVYIPRHNLWVGEYPYLQRDIFTDVSRQLGGKQSGEPPRRSTAVKRRQRF